MKKVIYAVLICIIIAGIVVIAVSGLRADLIYSKNVELDIYLGKVFERQDMEALVKEVFPESKAIIQEIEVFEDMCMITLEDNFTSEDLKEKVSNLVTKVNEKYDLELKDDDVTITHNPKIRLSSLILPFGFSIGISGVIILAFVGLRYKKLGSIKKIAEYIFKLILAELLLLSIFAIARIPVNRLVIPIGLVLAIVVLTVLGLKNEKKLKEKRIAEKAK